MTAYFEMDITIPNNWKVDTTTNRRWEYPHIWDNIDILIVFL
jgi:hypothetical protein